MGAPSVPAAHVGGQRSPVGVPNREPGWRVTVQSAGFAQASARPGRPWWGQRSPLAPSLWARALILHLEHPATGPKVAEVKGHLQHFPAVNDRGSPRSRPACDLGSKATDGTQPPSPGSKVITRGSLHLGSQCCGSKVACRSPRPWARVEGGKFRVRGSPRLPPVPAADVGSTVGPSHLAGVKGRPLGLPPSRQPTLGVGGRSPVGVPGRWPEWGVKVQSGGVKEVTAGTQPLGLGSALAGIRGHPLQSPAVKA